MRKLRTISVIILLLLCGDVFAQPLFSIATDFTLTRNFRKDQRYFSFGQTIRAEVHFTPKDGAYISYNYASPGKFKNALTATARDPLTVPTAIDFKSSSELKVNGFSLGWKHYLVGASNREEKWNLYFMAGFGIFSGRVTNKFDTPVDTAKYNLPSNPVSGEGKFKRLTFDGALGYEVPLGGAIYMYGEGRVFIPASDYPSNYLLVNDNAPFLAGVSVGLRILFD